jgi:hypothetical protein
MRPIIKGTIERPDADVVRRLRDLGAAAVQEARGRSGDVLVVTTTAGPRDRMFGTLLVESHRTYAETRLDTYALRAKLKRLRVDMSPEEKLWAKL